ncbi:MAG: hypothetical protein IT480_10725 [Gammaproteobacteria bacterium]|nr:hypothetical protein [Gammaproteobacteria bacterium]
MAPEHDRAAIDRLCFEIFEEDRRGAAIFDYLCRRWARRPTGSGLDSLIDIVRVDAYREVLDDLVNAINRGRDHNPTAGGEVDFSRD